MVTGSPPARSPGPADITPTAVAPTGVAPTAVAPTGVAPTAVAPAYVGRYELLAPIARGGSATVYLARVPDAPTRGCALKLLHPHLCDRAEHPEAVAELRGEAELAARIVHPNVVRVVDAGEDGAGFFLVMELVEGDSLLALMRAAARQARPLDPEVALAILDDALAGLQAAHELRDGTEGADTQGASLAVIHRDFSPQNILIGLDGVARLTDFGIARAVDRAGFTRTGVVKGKVGYMSPEQAQALPLTQRSDVWAAGVVAWELFTGRQLHQTDDPVAALLRIVTETPPRLRSVRPDLPEALDEVVASALQPDVTLRCPSVAAFRRALAEAWPGRTGPAPRAQVAALIQSQAGERVAGWRQALAAAPRARPATPLDVGAPAQRRPRLRWSTSLVGAAAGLLVAVAGSAPLWRAGAPAEARFAAPTIIASAQRNPYALVTDGRSVYWTSADGVYRVASDGKPWFTRVASAQDGRQLALDGESLYVAEHGANRLVRLSLPDGERFVLAGCPGVQGVAHDERHVYFTCSDDGTVRRVPKTGGADETIARSPRPGRELWSVVVDPESVFWSDPGSGGVYRQDKRGGPPARLAEARGVPQGVTADGDTVYFRDGDIDRGRLVAVPKHGGKARVMAAGEQHSFPRGVTTDARWVYWTGGPPNASRVFRASKTGAEIESVADAQLGAHDVVVHGGVVYWTLWGGAAVARLRLPSAGGDGDDRGLGTAGDDTKRAP
jgi:serine/threonine-protein kinase